jgi:hypothetical protein
MLKLNFPDSAVLQKTLLLLIFLTQRSGNDLFLPAGNKGGEVPTWFDP